MLPDAALRGAHWPGALGSSPIVNLHVVYDRRVLEHRFAAGVDTPGAVRLRPHARRLERRAPVPRRLALGRRRASSAMSPPRCASATSPALAELLPAARDARVERFSATKEHAATFRGVPGHRGAAPAGRDAAARASRWRAPGRRPAGRRRSRAPRAAGRPPRPRCSAGARATGAAQTERNLRHTPPSDPLGSPPC